MRRLERESASRYLAEIKAFATESPRINPGSEDAKISRIAIAGFECDTPKNLAECLSGNLRLPDEVSIEGVVAQQVALNPVEPAYNTYVRILHSRQPFISMSGFVGLAPAHVEVGNVTCIFLRGNVQYIVQICCEIYELVGEAHVHGPLHGGIYGRFSQS